MKNPQLHRVVWSKGMFLSPQHFQAQDRRADDVLQFRIEGVQPFFWGFAELEIDASGLAGKQQLGIARASGVMPDGTPFDFDVDAVPGSLTLNFPPSEQEATVYLALPVLKRKGLNVAPDAPETSSEVTRYIRRRDQDSPDDTSPNDKTDLLFGRPNFSLLLTRPAGTGYETLAVARVRRGENALLLDPQFIPPLLSLRGSAYLRQLLYLLIQRLVTRQDALWAPRRDRGKRFADLNVGETASFLFLQTISSGLAQLRHIQQQEGVMHPEPLFDRLLGLAGALTAFNPEVKVGDLPAYDHNNLSKCFFDLFEALKRLLDFVDEQKFVSLKLRQSPVPNIWMADIEDKRWLENTQIFLAIQTSLGIDTLLKRVREEVKVTSSAQIDMVYSNALRALQLRHELAPPATLPLRATSQYFRFDQAGPHWEFIKGGASIGIHVPGNLPDLKFEILIALP